MLHLNEFYTTALSFPYFTVIVVTCALLLDLLVGEPRRYHPLVGFGHWAGFLERSLHSKAVPARQQKWLGFYAVAVAIFPLVIILALTPLTPLIHALLDIGILYLAIGNTSLRQHARNVYHALSTQDIARARQRVAMLVSRDTDSMQPAQITRASIESILENSNDAVFGALFWYLVAGAPGVVLYRLSNTLDAMWGYKNERYLYFGWAAAKLDDVLNWIPARLTAITFALLGNTRIAFSSWIVQARLWESRNAGTVMASGAAALGITLGGSASYHGQARLRPVLGHGRPAEPHDIPRALRLLQLGIVAWLTVIILGTISMVVIS